MIGLAVFRGWSYPGGKMARRKRRSSVRRRRGSYLSSRKVKAACGGGKWKRKGFRRYMTCALDAAGFRKYKRK